MEKDMVMQPPAEEVDAGKGRTENQTQVLSTINEAKFSWFHVKAILISGVGFFTDAYDLFVIGLVKPMFAIVYYPQNNGKLPVHIDLWVTGIALAGTLLGQVFFGACGDYLGRKKIYLLTLLIIITATIGQSMAASTVFGIGADVELIFWRFIMGFGIGGDYPLSATIVAEYSSTKWRGNFLAAVFAMQGFGILGGSVVSLITVRSFKHKIIHESILNLDFCWRIIIGLGCLPAIATIYLRSKLPETPRYTLDVVRDEEKAKRNLDKVISGEGKWDDDYFEGKTADRITFGKLYAYLTVGGIWNNRNLWVLLGTTTTWFFLDIAFYSQNLFIPNVLTYINYIQAIDLPAAGYFQQSVNVVQPFIPTLFQPANTNYDLGRVYAYDTPRCIGICAEQVYNKVFKSCAGNAIVALMGTVPGYWFTVIFIEKLGRVFINWMGFSVMTIILIILASAYQQIVNVSVWLFIVMYAMTFFFANFGPNSTTFIQPVELFETKYRSTLHGISAASGKAGAILGALVIGYMFTSNKVSLRVALAVLACTNLVGTFCCMFVPEPMQLPLELSCHTESWFGRVIGGRTGYTLKDYRNGVTLEEFLASKNQSAKL